MNDLDKELLKTINGSFEYKGAYNIRKDGESISRNITEFTNIISKEDIEDCKKLCEEIGIPLRVREYTAE